LQEFWRAVRCQETPDHPVRLSLSPFVHRCCISHRQGAAAEIRDKVKLYRTDRFAFSNLEQSAHEPTFKSRARLILDFCLARNFRFITGKRAISTRYRTGYSEQVRSLERNFPQHDRNYSKTYRRNGSAEDFGRKPKHQWH